MTTATLDLIAFTYGMFAGFFLCLGAVAALLFTWYAIGELMGGVKTFWTGK
jgi:hypothetical protein